MIWLYKYYIERAEESLLLAKVDQAKALEYLYESIAAVTQAINELESPSVEK